MTIWVKWRVFNVLCTYIIGLGSKNSPYDSWVARYHKFHAGKGIPCDDQNGAFSYGFAWYHEYREFSCWTCGAFSMIILWRCPTYWPGRGIPSVDWVKWFLIMFWWMCFTCWSGREILHVKWMDWLLVLDVLVVHRCVLLKWWFLAMLINIGVLSKGWFLTILMSIVLLEGRCLPKLMNTCILLRDWFLVMLKIYVFLASFTWTCTCIFFATVSDN